jgi:hypothetical protein
MRIPNVLGVMVCTLVVAVSGAQRADGGEGCILGTGPLQCYNSPPTACTCWGEDPPVEGGCRESYSIGYPGIWQVFGCPGAGFSCTKVTWVSAICTEVHLCSRVDNPYQTYCLSDHDCGWWIVYNWKPNYTVEQDQCSYEWAPA